jgi:hypothetical protein
MASRRANAWLEGTARGRVVVAVGLVAVAALSNFRMPIKTFGQFARGPTDGDAETYLARCRRLAPHLPPKGRIGYIAAANELQTRTPLQGGRLTLLQHALAPRMIQRFSGESLVIFDCDEPAALPALEQRRDWSLLVDLDDGLKLFSTTGHE